MGQATCKLQQFGVAHPTGYPFTVLKIFHKIPVGDEVYRLNFMCAVISSAALFIGVFNLLVFILKYQKFPMSW
ncbi:MAG: DUF2723 domain-containing protein [Ignavibacteria bacterium]|nr:DUF2723 domain-containing protein [Ignavibacteria bacterium]